MVVTYEPQQSAFYRALNVFVPSSTLPPLSLSSSTAPLVLPTTTIVFALNQWRVLTQTSITAVQGNSLPAATSTPTPTTPVLQANPSAERSEVSNAVKDERDVCMTTILGQYIQGRPDGSLVASATNSVWSVWTVCTPVDSQPSNADIVYFRDHQARYLSSDGQRCVFLSTKCSEQAAWTVVRGSTPHFRDLNGLYLIAQDDRVFCASTPSKHSDLVLNFPVVEGLLRLKSGLLSRWRSRYFAFNSAVMSYWERKEDASVTSV